MDVRKIILIIVLIALVSLISLSFIDTPNTSPKFTFKVDRTEIEIEFPTEPTIEETNPSETVKNIQISSKGNDAGYLLFVSTYNPGFLEGEEKTLVEENTSFIDALNKYDTSEKSLRITSSQKTTFNGANARVDEAEDHNIRLRYMIFTNNIDQLYLLSYSSLKKDFSEDEWQSYIDSFHTKQD